MGLVDRLRSACTVSLKLDSDSGSSGEFVCQRYDRRESMTNLVVSPYLVVAQYGSGALGLLGSRSPKQSAKLCTSLPLTYFKFFAASTKRAKLGAVFCWGSGSTSNHSSNGKLPVRSDQSAS